MGCWNREFIVPRCKVIIAHLYLIKKHKKEHGSVVCKNVIKRKQKKKRSNPLGTLYINACMKGSERNGFFVDYLIVILLSNGKLVWKIKKYPQLFYGSLEILVENISYKRDGLNIRRSAIQPIHRFTFLWEGISTGRLCRISLGINFLRSC